MIRRSSATSYGTLKLLGSGRAVNLVDVIIAGLTSQAGVVKTGLTSQAGVVIASVASPLIRFDSNDISVQAKIMLLLEMQFYQSQIAATLGRSRQIITYHVQGLVKNGWITPSNTKYRATYRLTDIGRAKMQRALARFFPPETVQPIKRCGDCFHFKNKTEIGRGSWKTGSKTVLKCGVKNNRFLPESLRYGNDMSVNHLANDCLLWNYPRDPVCRRCVEKHYGKMLDTPIETALKNTSGLLFSNTSNLR